MRARIRAAQLAPLAFALMSSPASAECCAGMSVSPLYTQPRGTVQVSGSELNAYEAVDIYFDMTDEALAVTDASGNFGPTPIPVPTSALPGAHTITLMGRSSALEAQRSIGVTTRWASFGFNYRGRRNNPFENVINPSNVAELKLAWIGAAGGLVVSSPAVLWNGLESEALVGSEDHKLYAFSVSTLDDQTAVTGGAVESSPAVSGNSVYVGSDNGKLYAFRFRNHASLTWPKPAETGGPIQSSPTVSDGVVYVGSNDGKLYAFHATDGTSAWASPSVTGGAITTSSPAVANGIVYIGSTDGKLYAFTAATGAATVWAAPFATGGAIDSTPAVSNGVIYFGSEDGNIYAVNARTGKQKWSVATGGMVTSSAAVADGVVYIGSHDGKLYAVRAFDGQTLWTASLGSKAVISSPAVANGVVYAAASATIEAFDAAGCGSATCGPLWTASPGGNIESSPAISDGKLYVGSDSNKLYAFALNGGNDPAYKYRKQGHPPSRASLHPDMRLTPVAR